MRQINFIILEFLETMMSDLKRRSFDETGEQRAETLERVETLKQLIKELSAIAKARGEK